MKSCQPPFVPGVNQVISDTIVLNELRACWSGVRALQETIRKNTVFAFARGGGPSGGNLASIAENVSLVLACSVLNDALEQLRDEGHFSCGGRFLGTLHDKSKNILPWVDWDLIDTVIEDRNGLAHKAKVIPREDCLKYVDAIEQELRAWSVIS